MALTDATTFEAPGEPGSPVELKDRYENFTLAGGASRDPQQGGGCDRGEPRDAGRRENHRMMLEHYTQTKCLLVSYDPNPLGFF
jgi:hypothetical protein